MLSAALLTVAVSCMVIGPLAALGAAFAAQVADLARHAQAFAAEHKPSNLSDLASLPVIGPRWSGCRRPRASRSRRSRPGRSRRAQTVLKALGTLGRAAFLGALGTVIGFALMMFILFFAIRDGKRHRRHGARAVARVRRQTRRGCSRTSPR